MDLNKQLMAALLEDVLGAELSAAKVDDLERKHPDLKFHIRRLHDEDPTPTKKYLEWGTKRLDEGEIIDTVIDVIRRFHNALPRISKKDINQYKTLADVEDAIQAAPAPRAVRLKNKADANAVYLYSDDQYNLIRVKTKDAACYHGMGSGWCISVRESDYFYKYSADNTHIYMLIDKTDPEVSKRPSRQNPPFSKVAFLIYPKGMRDNQKADRADSGWRTGKEETEYEYDFKSIYDAHDDLIKPNLPRFKTLVEHIGVDRFRKLRNLMLEDADEAGNTEEYKISKEMDVEDVAKLYMSGNRTPNVVARMVNNIDKLPEEAAYRIVSESSSIIASTSYNYFYCMEAVSRSGSARVKEAFIAAAEERSLTGKSFAPDRICAFTDDPKKLLWMVVTAGRVNDDGSNPAKKVWSMYPEHRKKVLVSVSKTKFFRQFLEPSTVGSYPMPDWSEVLSVYKDVQDGMDFRTAASMLVVLAPSSLESPEYREEWLSVAASKIEQGKNQSVDYPPLVNAYFLALPLEKKVEAIKDSHIYPVLFSEHTMNSLAPKELVAILTSALPSMSVEEQNRIIRRVDESVLASNPRLANKLFSAVSEPDVLLSIAAKYEDFDTPAQDDPQLIIRIAKDISKVKRVTNNTRDETVTGMMKSLAKVGYQIADSDVSYFTDFFSRSNLYNTEGLKTLLQFNLSADMTWEVLKVLLPATASSGRYEIPFGALERVGKDRLASIRDEVYNAVKDRVTRNGIFNPNDPDVTLGEIIHDQAPYIDVIDDLIGKSEPVTARAGDKKTRLEAARLYTEIQRLLSTPGIRRQVEVTDTQGLKLKLDISTDPLLRELTLVAHAGPRTFFRPEPKEIVIGYPPAFDTDITGKPHLQSIAISIMTSPHVRLPFIHELVHFLDNEKFDLERAKIVPHDKDAHGYYNSPVETNAYFIESIDSFMKKKKVEDLFDAVETDTGPGNQGSEKHQSAAWVLVDWYLQSKEGKNGGPMSPHEALTFWKLDCFDRRAWKHLTPENKKKLMVRFYAAYKDLMHDVGTVVKGLLARKDPVVVEVLGS